MSLGSQDAWEPGQVAIRRRSLFCPIVNSVCPCVLTAAEVFILCEQSHSFFTFVNGHKHTWERKYWESEAFGGVFSTLDIIRVLDKIHRLPLCRMNVYSPLFAYFT